MKKNIYIITVVSLFFLYLLLGVSTALKKSPTFDEPIHIAAGYTVWKTGDFRIDPENGLLPNLTASFSLLFYDKKAGISIPDKKDQMWSRHDRWRLAQRILYTDSKKYNTIFFYSRLMMLITFGLSSAIALFFISMRFWGKKGALISLAIYCLSPNVIAHSVLANSDMASTLFFFLTAFLFWTMLNHFNLIKLVVFLLSFALLLISKMSGIIILPLLIIIAIIFCILRKSWDIRFLNHRYKILKTGYKVGILISLLMVTAIFSFGAIWSVYGLRYSMLPDQKGRSELNILWKKALAKNGFPQKTINLARKYKLLPEAYLYGNAYVLKHADIRHAFLDGKYSQAGWYSFFPLCFIYKTPLSIMIIVIAGLILPFVIFTGNYRRKLLLWYYSLPVITATVYFTVAVLSKVNIGHRHLLPVYLPLFLIAGGSAHALKKYKHAGKGIILLLLILFTDNIMIYPDYLSYFSSIAGGPSNGYRHLVDSSLDWGQDLKSLKQWLSKEHKDPDAVYISYFGSNDLDIYQMKQRRLLCDLEQRSLSLFKLRKGTYCISATMLQMPYFQDMVEWNPELEKDFRENQKIFNNVLNSLGNPQATRKLLNDHGKDYIEKCLRNYEKLRFAKLAYGLRAKNPDNMINYSILIYELSDDDLKKLVDE